LWDMVYFTVLCQTPESRKERHDMLLKEYLKSLKKTYLRTVSQRKKYNGTIIEEDQMPPESSNELYVLYDVLSLVLFYYSYTIERSGMWAGNGNTMEDLTNWTNRVDQRIQELDMEKMAKVLNVDVKWLLKVKHLEWDEPSEKSMSYKKRD
jgi:hypothetical protein